MSVKATERSMHVSLYMRGPLSRGCTMLGLCWHVLTGLRAPWSLLWGGEGRQERLSGPLFGAGPISGCTNVPFGFGYSLLVFEHLGCWGRVAMYKQVALYCVCSCSRSLFTCSEISVPSTQVGGRRGEPDSSQEPRSGAGPQCRCTQS